MFFRAAKFVVVLIIRVVFGGRMEPAAGFRFYFTEEQVRKFFMKRPRLKQTASLEERLKQIAQHCRVAKLRPGLEREQMLRKARQAETASNLCKWIALPGFRPE
jgi:hypothetical protein